MYRRFGNIGASLLSFILYGFAFHYYYQRQETLKFSNNFSAQLLGTLLISVTLVKMFDSSQADIIAFWLVAPPLMIFGFILLAEGFHGIKQFWRLLVGIISVPGLLIAIRSLLQTYFGINVISAKISGYFLWMIGFDATSQGTLVYVNGGAIDVLPDCTAFPLFFSSLELLIIIWLFFPTICQISFSM